MNTVYAQGSQTFENPLGGVGTLDGLFMEIVNVVLILAVPVIVFFIIFAGFTYVTAQGNPEKVKQASRSLMYGIIGGVIVLGSSAILVIIRSVVDAF